LEELGIPTVTIVEDIFEVLARTQAEMAGAPQLQFAVVKRTTGAETAAQLQDNFIACMRQVFAVAGIEQASSED